MSTKPMFGEYGVYVDGKMVGSICDDQLYVKPTASGRLHTEPVLEAPPYPGARPHLLRGRSLGQCRVARAFPERIESRGIPNGALM